MNGRVISVGLQARHQRAGYVPQAQGCGDCAHADARVHYTLCRRHDMAVQAEGRCPLWQAGAAWLREHPELAQALTGLSAAEVALLDAGTNNF